MKDEQTCHSDKIDDSDDDDENKIAKTCSDDIDEGLRFLIKSAQDNGLPNEWVTKLSKLVQKYRDVWRTSLGPDPPAAVTPFVTRLVRNARPYRCKGRRYNPEESAFLKQFIDDLLKTV